VEEIAKIIRTYLWSSYLGYVSLKHRQSFVAYEKIKAFAMQGCPLHIYGTLLFLSGQKNEPCSGWPKIG